MAVAEMWSLQRSLNKSQYRHCPPKRVAVMETKVARSRGLASVGSRAGTKGARPPYFQTKLRPEKPKTNFLEIRPPPLFQALDDRPPPPHPLSWGLDPALLTVFSSFPTREDILLFSNEATKIATVKLLKIIAGLARMIFHPCLLYM